MTTGNTNIDWPNVAVLYGDPQIEYTRLGAPLKRCWYCAGLNDQAAKKCEHCGGGAFEIEEVVPGGIVHLDRAPTFLEWMSDENFADWIKAYLT